MLSELPVSLAGVGSGKVMIVTEGVLTVLSRMGTIVPTSMAAVGIIEISTASVNTVPLNNANISNLKLYIGN